MRDALYTVFVDLKTVFNLTDRTLLWTFLRKQGGEGRLIEVLKELYRKLVKAVRFNHRFSELFNVELGVLQGDLLSPLLFIYTVVQPL